VGPTEFISLFTSALVAVCDAYEKIGPVNANFQKPRKKIKNRKTTDIISPVQFSSH
jgi:hypothetical protein